MANPTRHRPMRPPDSPSVRFDNGPADSPDNIRSPGPRFDVTLLALDHELLTMTARLRPGARTRSIERAIRRYLGTAIQERDAVQIYRNGVPLQPDERLTGDSQLLHYRVFPAISEPQPPVSSQAAPTSTNAGVGETPSTAPPDIEAHWTVREMRNKCARANNIEDPNTIEVRLRGGLRDGLLEGNDWQILATAGWGAQGITVSPSHQPFYLVLRGFGKEYLYQASNQDPNGVTVENVKHWLINRILRCVHPTLNTNVYVERSDISLYVDGEILSRSSLVIPWRTDVKFKLPRGLEEQFSAEERWLCPSFDCSLCGETTRGTPTRVSATCTHDPTVCMSCIQKWVSTCLFDDGWDKARCPQCSDHLSYNEIKASVSKEDFERYFPLYFGGTRMHH